MCWDFLYKFCLEHFAFQENFSLMLSYVHIGLLVKCPSLFSDFYQNWIFSTHFRKICISEISLKPLSVGAEIFMRSERHAGLQHEAHSRFSQFCNRASKFSSTWKIRGPFATQGPTDCLFKKCWLLIVRITQTIRVNTLRLNAKL